MNENEAKIKVVEAGIKLVESGLIARTWGNVSCRISDSHFVITPSGRDYLTITTEDIVLVRIDDLSYTGEVKPSGEKAVHAEIYKGRPEINFVIHTHQENASVISTLGLDSIEVISDLNCFGNKIICADYGLPGTKKLKKSVAASLVKSSGNAIIMKNHGAVCFGIDAHSAFQAAIELEKASQQFIANQFFKVNPEAATELEAMQIFMRDNIMSEYNQATKRDFTYKTEETPSYISERNTNRFSLKDGQGNIVELELNKVNQIIHSTLPYTLAFSRTDLTLLPYVDDFAQIIGTKVKMASTKPQEIANALSHSAAVFIHGHGALCTGETLGDALAVQMILEKNCKAKITGLMFGSGKPLNPLDTHLMRIVYLKKYAKQITNESKKNSL